MKIKLTLILLTFVFISGSSIGAPKAKLWDFWVKSNESSKESVDHGKFQNLIDQYLIEDKDGVNKVKYKLLKDKGRKELDDYISYLESIKIRNYSKKVQKPYWINLYNAKTIQVILDHYPVDSITEIDISPGIFSNGPWDKKNMTVEGKSLSLNDIEHRILRPIWKDERIHFAVNCASIGCPNLSKVVYSSENTDQLLDNARQAFLSHPRGVSNIKNGDIILSSIFDWYDSDFGNSEKEVLKYVAKYLDDERRKLIEDNEVRDVDYEYNWDLNEYN